ncbi:MAG: histidine phosphatase family protein [Burkholderiales bacterium]|nr:histidine phosphatase family protein [Burkholderiales bacterium]
MTQLILIRHGETVWNLERRMQGHRDSPLSEAGVRQARRLGERMRGEAFDALYSSDLGRAHRTAQSIAEATGREILVDARLRERHFGVFEGLTSAEIERDHPGEFERFRSRDPDYVVPGGESALQFYARCLACLEELVRRHAGGRIVAVTHGLVLDALYRVVHGLAPEQPRPAPLLNASLNVFRRDGACWHCEAWGDVAHLEQEGVVTRFEGSVV